ncbi:MAG: pyrroline-5-carboxylate reductase [Candidatus Gastranaerophilales bacterium]|nr:pyrroline-5-carboxylate reductase [Candidatus Gastranaerophilales bacterium]
MNKKVKIGFIGCGKMASAIIKGGVSSNFLEPENICASEISEEFANKKKNELKIKVFTDNNKVVQNSDVIFLATKPNYIKDVLKEVKTDLNKDKVIVSIAAGISTKTIEDEIGFEISVIRVMPNAPAMILEGMSGIARGKFAKDEQVDFIKEFLSKIGKCIIVEEDKIDILTAISGSGPAFFYKTINDIARAGEKLGLEYEKALLLSIQTAIGSAKLMLESDLSPEELIADIATKGGCTQVGVDFMENANLKELFFETIKKTAQKAQELGG